MIESGRFRNPVAPGSDVHARTQHEQGLTVEFGGAHEPAGLTVASYEGALAALADATFEMREAYRKTFGSEFDQFKLDPRTRPWAKQFYHGDGTSPPNPTFLRGLHLLGINPDLKAAIYLPWWNESICAEDRFIESETGIVARLSASHSYINQLGRQGYVNSASVSIAGILLARPCETYPDGAICLGVRGGNNQAGKIHLIPAGALQCSDDIRSGPQLGGGLIHDELSEEVGMTPEDLSDVTFVGRGWDELNGGPQYAFVLRSRLSASEVYECWVRNGHPDRGEHIGIHTIAATKESVARFLSETYPPLSDGQKETTAPETLQPCAMALLRHFERT